MADFDLDWPRFFGSALSAIWRARNDMVFSGTPHTVSRIWGFIRALGMEDIVNEATLGPWLSQQPDDFARRPCGSRTQQWRRPPEGWLKFNVDGALSSSCQASCGGVVRDGLGIWKLGFSHNLGDLTYSNVFVVELLAIKYALDLIISLELPQIIIESDSLEVVQFLNDGVFSDHQFEQTAREILQLMHTHDAVSVAHSPRETNGLADYLAKVGLLLPFGNHTFDSPFGEYHSLLRQDVESPPYPHVGSVP